ncbi:hypothetical protein [Nocardioides sp.]|uniref:hypothetical protein n=1 Tax=Nocardioides sp. TaxID=35761 RepID=UPI00261E8E7D|nr:hypothetical protein [Nocardioides sp.]MDI6910503.1 hypothetical protein [Nocardioides sp.]
MDDRDDRDQRDQRDMDRPSPPGGHHGGRHGGDLDRVGDQRTRLRLRHAERLTSLMAERGDLRGVHALADYFDDAVRWSA